MGKTLLPCNGGNLHSKINFASAIKSKHQSVLWYSPAIQPILYCLCYKVSHQGSTSGGTFWAKWPKPANQKMKILGAKQWGIWGTNQFFRWQRGSSSAPLPTTTRGNSTLQRRRLHLSTRFFSQKVGQYKTMKDIFFFKNLREQRVPVQTPIKKQK